MQPPDIWHRFWTRQSKGALAAPPPAPLDRKPAAGTTQAKPAAGTTQAKPAAGTTQAKPAVRVPSTPMQPLDHWRKTARAIEASVARAGNLTVLQETAARQLDSASYAFAELLTDLATAMPLPRLEAAPVVASVGPRPERRALIRELAHAA